MADCQTLCTAAKCAELESRIGSLEQALALLEASFEAHTNQNIPDAHGIDGNVDVNLNLSGNQLSVGVDVQPIGSGSNSVELDFCTRAQCELIERKIDGHLTLPVPIAHGIDTNVDVNVDIKGNELRVQVELQDIGVNSDTATLPIPEIPEIDLSNYCTIENCQRIERKIDNHLILPIPTAHEINSNVDVNVELFGETLRVQVEIEDIGTGSDTVSLDPLTSTIFITEKVTEEMNCDELENLINNKFNDLDNTLNNLSNLLNQIDNLINNLTGDINNISSDVNNIETFVTVDISGTIETGGCMTVMTDDNGETIQTDPFYESKQIDSYSAQGLSGINQALSLIDGKITALHQDTCKAQRLESQDVVSLVATDRAIPYISGKQLILHLVKLEDYPTRSSNSLWQVHIPAAKDEYVWETHFEPLRKFNGNVYAELLFIEPYKPVEGFFQSENAANNYFDFVLTLTNATEKRRIFENNTNPPKDIIERELRPYRAFITQLNANGQSECLAKYAPPITNE